jgi:hypothetical protein
MRKRTQLADSWLRSESWALWEWWLLATVVGGFLGIAIAATTSAVSRGFESVNTVAPLYLIGALGGAALGLAQWLVLRRYIKHVGGWIVATAIGSVIAWLIGLQVGVMLILIFFNGALFVATSAALLNAIFLLGIWVGTVLGFCQWLVLRTHVRNGALWIAASALAWGLALLAAWMGAALVQPGELGVETTLVGVATGATVGVVIGAITGVALVWLLKPRLLKHP